MAWTETLTSFLAALGLGLLNGVIRERRHGDDGEIAGTRTHALVAVLGFVTWGMGLHVFLVCLGLVGALTVTGYLKTVDRDRGLTGEVALLVLDRTLDLACECMSFPLREIVTLCDLTLLRSLDA